MKTAALKTPDGRWIARRLLLARTFRQRLLGLLQIEVLDVDEALLLSPGGSIHTFGMPYPIDAVFLNAQMKVLRLATRIEPWRVCLAPAKTKYVLELPAGRVQALGLQADTYLCIEHEAASAAADRCCDEYRAAAKRSACDAAAFRFTLRAPARHCDQLAVSRRPQIHSPGRPNGNEPHA